MVARKKRDYRAEYQRRNEKAKAEGYATYGKRRKLTEQGKITRSGKGYRANLPNVVRDENGKVIPVYKRAGWDTPQEYTKMMEEIKKYIEGKDGRSIPNKEEMNIPEIARGYYDVYVKGSKDEDRARQYLVDLAGKVTPADWAKKYAKRPWASNKAAVLEDEDTDSWEREQGM